MQLSLSFPIFHIIVIIVTDIDIIIVFGRYLSYQAPDEVLHEDEAERLPRPKAVRLLDDDTIRLVEKPPHQANTNNQQSTVNGQKVRL